MQPSAISHRNKIIEQLKKEDISATLSDPEFYKGGGLGVTISGFKNEAEYKMAETLVRNTFASRTDVMISTDARQFEAPAVADETEVQVISSLPTRLRAAAANAKAMNTLKEYPLSNGLMASTFVIDNSKLHEDESQKGRTIAVLVTASNETKDARVTISHLVDEAEQRLQSRGMQLSEHSTFLSRNSTSGLEDTGVILIPANGNPTLTLEKLNATNEIIGGLQAEESVFRSKCGRNRGEDTFMRRSSLPLNQSDPAEEALTARVQDAISQGILTVNSSDERLQEWIKGSAAALKKVVAPSTSSSPDYYGFMVE